MSQLTLDLYDELKNHFPELETPKMLAEYLTPLVARKIAAVRNKTLSVGDEVNQCLQIIISNAEGVPVIERAVARAARAIRSLGADV